MPLFKAPSVVMQKTRNAAWDEKTEGKRLGDARKLWGDYWLRFNTMQIPMFGEDEYFKTAVAIAEAAANEEEFGKLFAKRNKQRQEELVDLIGDIGMAIIYKDDIFPCQAAENAAYRASATGCFEYFVSLLRGNVLGWEADRAGDDMPNNTIAHFEEETKRPDNGEAQKPDDEEAQKPDDEEAQKPDDEEMQDSIVDEGSIDYENSTDYVGSFLPLSPSCETQYFPEYDYLYESDSPWEESRKEKEYRETRAGDIQEINSSDEDDMSHHQRGRRLLKNSSRHISATTASPNTSSIKQSTPGNSKKRVRFHDDDDDREHKRQRTQSPVLTVPNDAPSTQQSTVESSRKSSMERSRSDGDEDDVGHDVDRGRKRQRTQSPASAAPPVASSVRQPAVANSKKRSRTNDGDDDDDDDDDDDKGNQGRKRQKMESTASDPTPPLSSSTQKAADANVAKKRRRVSGGRKSRGQNSASGTPNTTSTQPLRRSVRRNNKSTLQELDRSGKPRRIR